MFMIKFGIGVFYNNSPTHEKVLFLFPVSAFIFALNECKAKPANVILIMAENMGAELEYYTFLKNLLSHE